MSGGRPGGISRIAASLAWLALAGCVSASREGMIADDSSRPDIVRTEKLRTLEQEIEDAISRRDADFLDRVTAPTFTRTDENGRVEERAAVMALIRKPPPTSDIIRRTIDRATQQVQLHGDIAVTRTSMEVRGPRRAFRSTLSRVYRWRPEGWQLLSSTTIATQPLTP